MVETDPVETRIIVDDSEVKRKFDAFESRIKTLEGTTAQSGKKAGTSFFGGLFGGSAGSDAKANAAGKKASGAFMGGLIGGAVGFAVGALSNNAAVNATLDLLVNILAAAILPVLVALLPLIIALTPILVALGEAVAKLVTWIIKLLGVAAGEGNVPFLPNQPARVVTKEDLEYDQKTGETRIKPEEKSVTVLPGLPFPVNRDKLYGPGIVV